MPEPEEKDKKPGLASVISKYFTRRTRKQGLKGSEPGKGAAPGGDAAQGPAAQPKPAAKNSARASAPAMKGAFRGFLKDKVPLEKPKPGEGLLGAPADASGSLPEWSTKKFKHTPDQEKERRAAGMLMNRFAAMHKKHPVRSLVIIALILIVIVFDVALLFGRFSATEWVAINYMPDSAIARHAQGRQSIFNPSIEFATPEEDRFVLGRSTEAFYGIWSMPPAPAGVQILSKEEAKKLALVKGIKDLAASGAQSYFERQGVGGAQGLDRTIVTKTTAAAKSAYEPVYDAGGPEAETGPKASHARLERGLAKKAESMNMIAEQGFADAARRDEGEEIPEGRNAEEMLSRLGDRNKGLVQAFAQKMGWTLNKHDGDPDMPKLPEDGLGKSWAAWQLLETLRLNNRSTNCGTCPPEQRINDGRAEYYGEKR
ncbi:MAG: hypothetical protein HY922_07065 [Elusimicrobia bacterium]|nr:hypothetical protein [Elusimicrobiota bacterium]